MRRHADSSPAESSLPVARQPLLRRAKGRLGVTRLLSLSAFLLGASANADDRDLAAYFGFDGLEVIKIDNNAGPFLTADMNGDGLIDIVVANNSKSRIEVQYQKAGAKPTDEVPPPSRVNELPEHWRFRRESISVGHQITGLAAHDFDGDGLVDLIYAGQPGTIGFLRQVKAGVFELARKTAVKGLAPLPDAFAVVDLVGDDRKDIAAIVSGRLTLWPLDGTTMGDEVQLGSGGDQLVALLVSDFDADGLNDVIGIAPDHPTPVRLWLASPEGNANRKALGSQLRFEMPPLVEAAPLAIPGLTGAALATIERSTKRLVVYDLKPAEVESSGTREAPLTVWSFADPGNRKRSVAVADIDGDGLLDLLATNRQDNAAAYYRQVKGKGLQPPVNAPAYADLDSVVAGDIDGDPAKASPAEIFLLSEKEGVVGRTKSSPSGIGFPQALTIAAGHVPVVQSLVTLDEGPRLAVVAKDGRNYILELLALDGSAATAKEPIKLGSLAKQPDAIVALDADQDGHRDILLLTADKPMIMLHRSHDKDAYELRESKDMGQFGLVQAANDLNNAALDIDGDGKAELLVADRNFIRALRYEETPAAGSSPGWQVVQQINADRGDAKLVSLAVLPAQGAAGASLVASDRENSSLLLFSKKDGLWQQTDALTVSGFKFGDIRVGAFSGDGTTDILAIGEDGFAIARLSGSRLKLNEIASWRSDSQRRTHHELVIGDANGDQRVDIIALDAAEQMAEVLTFSDARRLLYATSFKVFESRMFSGGEPREFEPSMGSIADVTGDGAADLILLCHDRLLLYPQSTKPTAAGK
ncbi:MAG: VCBS repeat-containing protein [Phycisphaerae bacterium]|nr:VCBS repeat-containing protein [Phycisphaerae bacterium]